MVLQRFRGELTMLDGRGGGEGGASYGGENGGYRERAPAAAARAPAPARAGGGGGGPSWEPPMGGDLDDEIPF